MTKRGCHNCIYCYYSWSMKMSAFAPGFPARPLCSNHPDAPGQLREVSSSGLCRNYRPKPPAPEGDIKRIPLGNGQFALVDAADYEWLSQWNWRLYIGGYAMRQEKGKKIFMHHEIVRPPQGMLVDHVDGNRANNCRSNLRACTRQQNMQNKGKQSGASSKFKGVGYNKARRRWYAKLVFNGERFWLGYFDDEAEAARAYDRQAVECFGEFARLNFPEEWPPERRQEV